MKVLFVVPPLAGHINPTRGVGAALLAAGHEVAWCGHGESLKGLPDGHTLYALGGDSTGLADPAIQESRTLKGLRSVKFFYERFLVPLAHAMVPGVRAAVEAFQPDVMVVDQQALAGVVVARERGIPWLTSCTTSAGIVEPLEEFPQVIAWRDGLFAGVQEAYGLSVVRRPGLSEAGILVFSSALLAGQADDNVHFVGPVATARPDVPFPWDALSPGRRVLVSLGTVSFARGEGFYRAVVEGLGGLDLQVVLVAPESLVPDLPANFLRRDFVPQVALLDRVDAVVSHGGHNTVVESLAAGRPMVLAPIRDDQPIVTKQVVRAGAGIRIKFGRVRAEPLRDAVLTVLEDPSYAAAAKRVGQSLIDAGGADAAVRIITSIR